MKAKTRLFGEIEIGDDKIITLEKGMIGFPDLNHFTLIFDEEKGIESSSIMWLQSMDDPDTAFPVMDPHRVKADYNPSVNEKILSSLGELRPDNTFVLNTVTVPKKVEDFTMNLKAPIIINTDNMLGAQIIVEDDFPVKFRVYDILHKKDEKAGE
jgi:flagellar assembly factor FliW